MGGGRSGWGVNEMGGDVAEQPLESVGRRLSTLPIRKACRSGLGVIDTVLCITVGGSRNGPPPTTNSPLKSEASSANSILARINRFFDFWTLLALYIYKSRI